ncbi:GNAT family N-acetyltransferase [Pararhizobium mangrovi]|uniref:GNAT family N-acetyltransferase n=1 Tax=Pararhizobium mangrovi TaxID=2590452 RepID=A0A506TYF4_9HYPH|nr:GNAT family protein [Pararhizobium mangrovi]TPW26530.1 GNAT family N-acetyltransferase [Pararhizobium mangrovi]
MQADPQWSRSRDDSSPGPGERLSPECPILLTERLVLRPPHVEDIDAIADLANDARIATMVSRMPHPYTRKDAVDFVRNAKKGAIGKCVYAVTLAETGTFCGCCGLDPQPEADTLELGYWLGAPFWGKGYATEAAHALVDMAFRTRDIDRLHARCRVTNAASRRVIEKCGLQYQGETTVASLALGRQVPVRWYRLDRTTWISLRSWSGKPAIAST